MPLWKDLKRVTKIESVVRTSVAKENWIVWLKIFDLEYWQTLMSFIPSAESYYSLFRMLLIDFHLNMLFYYIV